MTKNLIYGREMDYLSQLRKELLIYTDDCFFDGFSNLIAERKGEKGVLAAICASENAFLVSQLQPDGKVKISPLFDIPESYNGARVLSPAGRQGILDAKECTVDFFTGDEKQTARIVKPGDVIYLKPSLETLGDSYITNQLSWFLKQILSEFLKTKSAKLSVAFLRETRKGAYALGKNYPAEAAYFITCCENLPQPLCFVKKEGDFVSPMEIPDLPVAVLPKEVTPANAYFLASGCEKVCGIALNAQKLPGGQYQIKKEAVKALFAFLETLS